MSAPSPALLYQHLADDVARMIASGTLRPGDKLPSLREMRVRLMAGSVVQPLWP